MTKELVQIPRATLDIFKYELDGLIFYEFDATACQPPEPMVNTMVCLSLLQDENFRLVAAFFHEPTPLFEKTSVKYSHEATELESGDFRVVFQKRSM